MTHYTNADIVPAALRGEDAQTGTGNMSTRAYRAYAFAGTGALPSRLSRLFRYTPTIDRVIYSYATPIAWRDRGVWIVPSVRYSITTSSKHATHLYRLPNARNVPWDAGAEEYEAVVTGRAVYVPWEGRYGTYRAA